MTEPIGLAPPPPLRHCRWCPALDGVLVFVTGAGTGQGHRPEFARLGAPIVIASRKPEHLDAGRAAIEAIGAPVLTVECDIREPDSIAAAFDAATEAFGLPQVSSTTQANFPVRPRTCRPTPGAPSSTSPSTAPTSAAASSASRHLGAGTRASIVNVPARGRGGPGFAHSAAGQGRGQNLTETLAVEWARTASGQRLVPGLVPHEDMTADIQGNLKSLTTRPTASRPCESVGP
jgi:NAD(P)-dependent dehydrogenase (short-subunit alcohol dehydrogenase family)